MRGRSPWTPEGGLGCARTGVLRRAEEVRLVSPGAEQSRRRQDLCVGALPSPGRATWDGPGAFCNEPATWLDRDL